MSKKHEHNECQHENLQFCKCCGVVYCEDCDQEWGKERVVYRDRPVFDPFKPVEIDPWRKARWDPYDVTVTWENQTDSKSAENLFPVCNHMKGRVIEQFSPETNIPYNIKAKAAVQRVPLSLTR